MTPTKSTGGREARQVRHQLVQLMLQHSEPASSAEIAALVELPQARVESALEGLVKETLVVKGELIPGRRDVLYSWAARFEKETGRRASRAKTTLERIVELSRTESPHDFGLNSKAVVAFNDYILSEYRPPKEKRFLVFYQCSVRRPFSKSPSHGTINRATLTATGFHPARDFERCPVHVVVLASYVGPVPYELEDVYPANVRAGGVKHMHPDHYAQAKPILVERMARYMATHGPSYEHMAAFADSRYAEVIREAARAAKVRFRVFPKEDGPIITRRGKHPPRKYWDKYWIQLFLEEVRWLDPASRSQAFERLKKLQVEYAT